MHAKPGGARGRMANGLHGLHGWRVADADAVGRACEIPSGRRSTRASLVGDVRMVRQGQRILTAQRHALQMQMAVKGRKLEADAFTRRRAAIDELDESSTISEDPCVEEYLSEDEPAGDPVAIKGRLRGKSIDRSESPRKTVGLGHHSIFGGRNSGDESTLSSLFEAARPRAASGHDEEDHATHAVFVDADALNADALGHIAEKDYDVETYYFGPGEGNLLEKCATLLAKSLPFQYFTTLAVAVNAIYIGVEIQLNTASSLSTSTFGWWLAEQLFCYYFTFELSVRFLAFKHKINCLRDMWFKFDSVLVLLMVVETWIFPSVKNDVAVVRLLRIIRVARLMRLIRKLPELVTMVRGMVIAVRSVISALLLLMILVYVFGIVFNRVLGSQLVGDDEHRNVNYSTLSEAMWSLAFSATLLDNITVEADEIHRKSPLMFLLYIFFFIITHMTLLNMLIGVVCTVMNAVAHSSRERGMIAEVKSTLLKILQQREFQCPGYIHENEFWTLLGEKDANAAFARLGVDVETFAEIGEFLFDEAEAHDSLAPPIDGNDGRNSHQHDLQSDFSEMDGSPSAANTSGKRLEKSMSQQIVTSPGLKRTRTVVAGEDVLTADLPKITYETFLLSALKLRDDAGARMRDIVHLKKLTRTWLLEINDCMEDRFDTLEEKIDRLDADLLQPQALRPRELAEQLDAVSVADRMRSRLDAVEGSLNKRLDDVASSCEKLSAQNVNLEASVNMVSAKLDELLRTAKN